MAQFKDLTDEALTKLGSRLIRNISSRVSKQVPTPTRNPFSKGDLSRSLNFTWGKADDGKWSLSAHYADHGKYTRFGTRNYFDRAYLEQSLFGLDFTGYQKGKGGVRSQNWMSLRGDLPVYEAIIEAEVRLTWEMFVKNTVSELSKKK